MTTQAPDTNASLIARLASDPADPDAWSRFVFLYGPHLIRWCRQRGLQEHDARDVAQEVLLLLARHMKQFAYDPSKRFRGWLRTIARNAWADWAERNHPANRGRGDDAALARMREVAGGDELVRMIEAQHERELLARAMARVGRRVQPRTMQAFRLFALEGVPAREVAERTGMKLESVYAAKAKVQRFVREEVEKLDAPG